MQVTFIYASLQETTADIVNPDYLLLMTACLLVFPMVDYIYPVLTEG